jgi:hypothetical protein
MTNWKVRFCRRGVARLRFCRIGTFTQKMKRADLRNQPLSSRLKLGYRLELINDLGSNRQFYVKFTVIKCNVLLKIGKLDDGVIAITLVEFLHCR